MVVWKILLPLPFCCIAKNSRSSTGTSIIRNTGNDNEELASYQSMVLSLLYQFLSLSNAETFKNHFSAIFSALSTSNNALL
jgi:hypothetical protein